MLSEFIDRKPYCFLLLAIGAAIMPGLDLTPAQNGTGSKQDSPVGDWRGMSTCQVKPSGCHDEDSLYHFKPYGTNPSAFEPQADKIVDGKPVTMGTGPCHYDSTGKLVCPVSEGGATLMFDVRGDEMKGIMKTQNGTIWRKIILKKVQER